MDFTSEFTEQERKSRIHNLDLKMNAYREGIRFRCTGDKQQN